MERNGGGGNEKGDLAERTNVNGGDPASAARGSELLSILLKRPLAPETPQPKQGLLERSKTPPLQPTVSREEASRPLTPPARLPRNNLSRPLFPGNAPNSPSKRGDTSLNRRMQRPPGFQARGHVNGRKGENEEGDLGRGVEVEEKKYNELGLEVKEGVPPEGQQGPVARWRLQRNPSANSVDDRALQNKPKGPDGTKGFAAGRGRLLTTADAPKGILGEPPKDASSSRPASADISKGRGDVSERGRRPKQQADEKDLEVQLKIAQFLVQRDLEEAERERVVTREEKQMAGRVSDEEAPFAPPPSRQGSRKVEGSPSGSVHGEKAADASLSSVHETGDVSKAEGSKDGVGKAEGGNFGVSKPEAKPSVRKEPQAGGDLQRLTQFLEGAFGKQAGATVPRADFVTRAADEWLETDLVSARNKVFAVLEKCVGTPGYGDLVDLEKHLKATLNELRRYRAFVESERSDAAKGAASDGPKAESDGPKVEKLEGEVGRLKYDLGAAQMEIGRLEAELAFERVNGGEKKAAAEGGVAQLERELERVRLELRAWQGEVEKLKGALEKSEELRQAEGLAAKESVAAKEAENAQLQQELGSLRARIQETEESLQRSFESERHASDAEIGRLRAKAAADAEEIERLRARSAAESEKIERLQSQLAASDDAVLRRRLSVSDAAGYSSLSDFDGRHVAEPQQQRFAPGGSAQQQFGGGEAADILDQLLSKPGGGAGSGMTWQQQELTRQDSQGAFPSFPQRQQPEAPTGSHLTWQQQELTRQQEPMTRQQEPHRTFSGGHFAGQPRPPVLHETDLAFAHQQRQLVQQQRLFQGGHFQGPGGPLSAPQFLKYPAPSSGSFWDNPVISGGPSRGPYSHLGHPPQPGPQRTGPGHPYGPQAPPPQGLWPRELGHASLSRTASAVEQEMLGRTRQAQNFGYSSSAMPIPVSVLLAAGRAKQTHDVAHQRPATSEELGLIEDDEVLFKGR